MTDLVEAEALAVYLGKIGAPARAVAVADEAAATASAFVAAYCSRLRWAESDPPAPLVVRRVALHVAARLAANPNAIRSLTAEGQSTDLPPVGFTYLESVLLNPYRRRTA